MKAKAPKKPAKKPAKTGINKKARSKRGMTPFVPTDENRLQVELMVGIAGLEYRQISQLIINPRTGKGISVETLQKHFKHELTNGRAQVKHKVTASLLQKGLSKTHPGAVAALIWITKSQFGWKGDHVVHEVKGDSGVLVAPPSMTPEEWILQAEKANEGKKAPDSRKKKE